ncbi:ABC transporter ATP-binding protein [Catenulispora yoronensis]|uniref:ABC transporter ATP-binding protein n=1 Tax=Catenulispora yoronensis TaxID=450799 RepID=A0ABN2UJ02_9ACTN
MDIELSDAVVEFQAGSAPLRALNGISVRIPSGESVSIVGPSGSGKSTLLHVIGAMEQLTAGSVTVGGRDLSRLRESGLVDHRRRVGFVFQRFHLLPALTVLDNVVAPTLPYRTSFDKRKRARELLAAVGLADRAADLPGRLSGGQQQRVAIARALIGEPGVVLADEPTGSLDSATGREVVDLLLRMRSEYKFSLLISTHDAGLARVCRRRLRLSDGALVGDEVADAAADAAADVASEAAADAVEDVRSD